MLRNGSAYKIKHPIMAVMTDRHSLVTIPEGGIAQVKKAPHSDDPKAEIEVEYDSKILVVFAIDLKERGELISAASGADFR